jgi:hypothetical protein
MGGGFAGGVEAAQSLAGRAHCIKKKIPLEITKY